ncbi:hypothetical protein BPAE_0079g00320 [Botrytis paeoniae]|uniref:Fungal N-terminal domain-containing protein n=1 Tax=Botrytis paeoniae TaxID=278948 RepID=A0A4Z1FLV0_9HELO|nr:hypothetical protein BPAE_0079g00320 [Botrytis paeoniae]
MSDPFSAASGAVRMISLGIQVSQGLVKYCSQVKNFTSEIATFKAKAESVDGILQNLESVLKKTEREQKTIPKSVILTLNGCAEILKKLNEGVGRHGKDRLSNRLTYCFVRDDLAASCNMLDSLQDNLSNALQVWMLYISSKQQPLLQTPSLLAQRCLELNAPKAESSLLLLKYKHNVRLRLPRPCPCQGPASQYADGPRHCASVDSVLWKHNFSSRHTCPTCEGWQIIRRKYNVCNKLLGYSIAFTIFLTRGAGGFSIGPLLGFNATAPTLSPAFRLLYATKYRNLNRHPFQRALDGKSWVYSEHDAQRMHPEFDSSGRSHWGSSSHVIKYDEPDKVMEQLEELVNHTLNELRILFQNGKVSPNDLDKSGVPLSEVVCRWLIFAFDNELIKLSKTRTYSKK